MVMQNYLLDSLEIMECDEAPLDLSVSNRDILDKYRDTRSPDYPNDSYWDRASDDIGVDREEYHKGLRDSEYMSYLGKGTTIPADDDDDDVGVIREEYYRGRRDGEYSRYCVKEKLTHHIDIINPPRDLDTFDSHKGRTPHDSEAFVNTQGATPKTAKSYKKAIMRRYLDTDTRRRRDMVHHRTPISTITSATTAGTTSSNVEPSTSRSNRGTSPSSSRSSWRQVRPGPSSNSPTHNSMYNTNDGTYTTHPAAHVGHRTVYFTSHPKTLVDTDRGSEVADYRSMIESMMMISTTRAETIAAAVPGTSSCRGAGSSSSRGSWYQDNSHPSSSSQNSMYNTNEVYTMNPAAHIGHQTAYSISYPKTSVVGCMPPSPTNSDVSNVVASCSGHTNNDGIKQRIYLNKLNRGFSNSGGNNWMPGMSVEYNDRNLCFPSSTDSISRTDGLSMGFPSTDSSTGADRISMNHIDSSVVEIGCYGNLVNEDNGNLHNLSPQDPTLDIPDENPENVDDPLIRDKGNPLTIQITTKKPEFDITLSKGCLEAILRKVPGVASRARWPKSWEFVIRLLVHEETNPYLVRWEDKSQYIFRLVQSNKLTHIWNTKSEKASHNYYNFARGLRYHYKKQILIPIKEKQLVYQCGPKAIEYYHTIYQTGLR